MSLVTLLTGSAHETGLEDQLDEIKQFSDSVNPPFIQDGKLVMFSSVENDHFGNPLTVFWSEDGAEWEFSTDWGAKDECIICGESTAPGFFWDDEIGGCIVCENCVEVNESSEAAAVRFRAMNESE